MKYSLVCLLTFTFSFTLLADKKQSSDSYFDFWDPRNNAELLEWIKDGEVSNYYDELNHSILIVAWDPNPERQRGVYQISGIDGYYSRDYIYAFLDALYLLKQPKTKNSMNLKPLNIIVTGNNWGMEENLGKSFNSSVKNIL